MIAIFEQDLMHGFSKVWRDFLELKLWFILKLGYQVTHLYLLEIYLTGGGHSCVSCTFVFWRVFLCYQKENRNINLGNLR